MKFSKTNIDFKKIVSILFFMLLIFVWNRSCHYQANKSFSSLTIQVKKEKGSRSLVSKKTVMNMIREHLGFDPTVASINQINFWKLEKTLKLNPYIKDAKAYVDANLNVHIEVVQRKPLARIISDQEDYYVDETGIKIPPTDFSTLRVPIVSGNIAALAGKTKEDKAFYNRFISLTVAISSSDFTNALIDQIVIKNDKSIVFVPKVGQEKILFGLMEDTEAKLQKLSDFYRYGIQEKGWNKYAYLDLSYKGQIVCGK